MIQIKPVHKKYRYRLRNFFPRLLFSAILLLFLTVPGCLLALPYPGIHLDKIELPDGFAIDVYTAKTPGARSLAMSPSGTLFVGTRSEGKIYAVIDNNNDQKADKVIVIDEGLNSPNGVAFVGEDLYVSEISRVIRYDDIGKNPGKNVEPEIVNDSFPDDKHHGWKYMAYGPDNRLYIPVGAPCNVCLKEDPRYASIMRMKPNGNQLEIFARGIRNTVGFDWNPKTDVLWFTNNGRDWMGDNRPPDTLHRAPEKGLHFGFPFCHAGDIPDPQFGRKRDCNEFAPTQIDLGPHVAALGMKFYTGNMFPEKYNNRIFIAEHGSWNRTVPIGYRITTVTVKNKKASDYQVFAKGWLQGAKAWGRPVDVLIAKDGSLFVSDDRTGAVYRIYYKK